MIISAELTWYNGDEVLAVDGGGTVIALDELVG
jgi:hypothetical protein